MIYLSLEDIKLLPNVTDGRCGALNINSARVFEVDKM